LLIVLNPLETEREFVFPPGAWTAEFCSASVDGAPVAAQPSEALPGAALSVSSASSAMSSVPAGPGASRVVRLPAHTLRVYSAPRTSLGEPDAPAPAQQPEPAPDWPGATDFLPTDVGTLFVDRRGEP
jgi:hypothetical protein